MKTGTIKDFRGSLGSGIATLVLEVGGVTKHIHCENVPTVQALDAMFPGAIAPGHCLDVDVIRGQVIEFEIDGLSGVLLGIGPA